ncbi:PIG-L deacetylase family protein [Paenibacillus sp. D2_2]|uniref:PIG-L deacetylase family protein n=1 Tax=Paenibacillus sp. D2_2 TaxID=3073092 RepID=UPI0028157802|nr:PIG-L deacetylase family protein [Paenibacillus sp. D2_2]WMT42482.1 PIG-L deacetylase family protein [Paenibacillus sp. D2_2]
MKRNVGFVYAHPDDETFGCSFLIRQIADEGGNPVLLTATPGNAGKTGRLGAMTQEELAEKRRIELQQAADILGITEIVHLDMGDGKLKEVDQDVLAAYVADFLRSHQIEVVITFPEDGISGHADHIAIHQAVNKVVFGGQAPSVQKLYYNCLRSKIDVDSAASLLSISAGENWQVKRDALAAHESQIWSIERVFGDLQQVGPESFDEECFLLVWERGVYNPNKQEKSIFDDLV